MGCKTEADIHRPAGPLMSRLVAALRDRRGVTAMEYGMIAAIIAVAIIGALLIMGEEVTQLFVDTENAVSQVGG
jgi:pilus assembly protein Flp/PilA